MELHQWGKIINSLDFVLNKAVSYSELEKYLVPGGSCVSYSYSTNEMPLRYVQLVRKLWELVEKMPTSLYLKISDVSIVQNNDFKNSFPMNSR